MSKVQVVSNEKLEEIYKELEQSYHKTVEVPEGVERHSFTHLLRKFLSSKGHTPTICMITEEELYVSL